MSDDLLARATRALREEVGRRLHLAAKGREDAGARLRGHDPAEHDVAVVAVRGRDVHRVS